MKSRWNSVWQWLAVDQRAVWLEYGGIALLILLPFLLPGYILTLDMVFTPHMAWPGEVTNTYPLDVLLWLLSQILPGDVIQKAILFVILVFSGVGAHSLVRQISPAKKTLAWQSAAYFGGLLYMINPFVYSRFMAGQWLVLLGYALLPFLFCAFFRLLAKPSWRHMWAVAAWGVAAVAASVHLIGIVAVVAVLFLVAGIITYSRKKTELGRFVLRVTIAMVTVIAVSSYWIIPTLFGQNMLEQIANSSGDAEFAAYATTSGPLGAVGEVVRLQGFWAETRQLFVLPQAVVPLWGVLVALLWVLVVIGAIYAWKTARPLAVVMIGSSVAGVLLAATPLIAWLSELFPLFGGYREPHKFTMLVVIGFAVLGAFGVARLVEKRRRAKVWATACLVLPLVMTPTMLWGAGGQLRPTDYPPEWYSVNSRLKTSISPGKHVLFLPWHMYAPYSFSRERIIANPAGKFFEIPVVVGNDPEFDDVSPHATTETHRQISQLLKDPEAIASELARLDIQFVVLAKEQDWDTYDFLDTDGLQRIHEDEKLIVYEVDNEGA